MNRIGKLALVAGILAIALAVPIATAHLIFVYEAYVTVKPVTPVVWLYGNSEEVSAVNLSLTNKTSPQISLTIPITNSSETYVYQALEVKVNAGSPYLYVGSCSYTGPELTAVNIIVYPTTASPTSPTGTIEITPSTSSGCTASGYVQLTAGNTYYVDFQVEPSLPIPNGASSGTLTINFALTNQSGTASIPTP
ncbi:MAG: hypothetical protein MGAcid_15820 [uncultured Acidilobus sp. MG]|jgi:hypothetical protein|nr:MAG: hypothetical protein MGAcid_15820 [uncultured Acidilobus sp. MG]